MGAYSDFVANILYGGTPAPNAVMKEIIDRTSTSATITVSAGCRYVFTQPLTSLTVSGVENYAFESELQFTAGDGATVSFPDTLGWMGEPSFAVGKSYIINIRNNIAVCSAYTPGVTA